MFDYYVICQVGLDWCLVPHRFMTHSVTLDKLFMLFIKPDFVVWTIYPF